MFSWAVMTFICTNIEPMLLSLWPSCSSICLLGCHLRYHLFFLLLLLSHAANTGMRALYFLPWFPYDQEVKAIEEGAFQ